MPTLNIEGKSVKVDDSFLSMSPEQQNAAVDEISKSIGATPVPKVSAPATDNSVSTVGDMAKSFGTGLAKGAIGIAGIPGDLDSLVKSGANYIASKIMSPEKFQAGQRLQAQMPSVGPGTGDIQKAIESQTGEFYKPQTTAGNYAQTMGEFAPGILGGPGGIVRRGLTQVAAPAIVSETAGQATKGTAAEPYARIAGALTGGIGASMGATGVENYLNGRVPGISRGASNQLISAVKADDPVAVRMNLSNLGPDATLADAGPALLGKAQGASLNSDEARSILQNVLTQRNQTTNSRIGRDVNSALGPAEDPQTVTNFIRETRSAADAKAYPAALNSAGPVDTANVLSNLGPMIGNSVGMEQKALTNAKNMLMTQKQVPRLDPQTGYHMTDAKGNALFDSVPTPQTDPNILHKIKGELDNVIQYDQPGLGVPAGALTRQQGALKVLRGQINSELEKQVPGYAEANAKSAMFAKRAEAVDQGTQYLGNSKTTPSPDRFSAEFNARPTGEQIAFAKGSRGNIDRVLGTKANDLQALKGELQGEGGWNTAKISTVHGQDAADQLVSSVDRNLKFRDTHNKVVENSQTAQRQAAASSMKPEEANGMPLINPNMSITGLLASGSKKAMEYIADKIRRDPTSSYGEIAKVLTAQGPQRDAHLRAIVDALTKQSAVKPSLNPALASSILGSNVSARQPILERQ